MNTNDKIHKSQFLFRKMKLGSTTDGEIELAETEKLAKFRDI